MQSPARQIGDRRRSALVVGCGAALFTSLVVGDGLGSNGLRDGEALSISTSWRSWSSVFDLSRSSDSNSLLYRVGLKIWMLGGTSTGWLRISSALCVVIAVGIVAWLATRLVNRIAGVVAASVLVFSGTVLELGQYVRFYAPVMAVAAASLAAWTTDIGRPRGSSLAVWSACSFLLVGCSVVSVAVVLGQLFSLYTFDARQRHWRRRLIGAAPSCALCIALTVFSGEKIDFGPFNQPFKAAAVADLLYLVTGSGGWQGLLAYSVVGLVAFRSALHVVRSRNKGPDSNFLPMVAAPWLIVAVGIFLMLTASVLPKALVGRYPAFLIPAVALALGCGIGLAAEAQRSTNWSQPRSIAGVALPRAIAPLRSNRQVIGVLVFGAALAFGAVGGSRGWRDWRSNQRVDWAPVVKALSIDAAPGDAVLFGNDSVRLSFDYYLRRDPKLMLPRSVFPSLDWGGPQVGSFANRSFSSEEVSSAMKHHRRVWLVVETPLVEHPPLLLALVLDRFDAVLVHSFGPTAVVYRIDAAPF